MHLTERQYAIAQLVSRGLSDKEICVMLGIRHSTLRTHLTRMFRRADVTSRGRFAACFRDDADAAEQGGLRTKSALMYSIAIGEGR
jgi:DNA-binding CsgD family transcriptional regulator